MIHLTKNLCVNLLGFLGVYGKPKDTLEVRQDLQCMKQRATLHPEKRDKGRHYLGPACYTLSKTEKQSMFVKRPLIRGDSNVIQISVPGG